MRHNQMGFSGKAAYFFFPITDDNHELFSLPMSSYLVGRRHVPLKSQAYDKS